MSYQIKASVLLTNGLGGRNSLLGKFDKLRLCRYETTQADKKPAKPQPKGIKYSDLTIGVPKETYMNEKRVSLTPAAVKNLSKQGFKLNVEENAGSLAKFSNKEYEEAGAKITTASSLFNSSDIILKVRSPEIKVT
jgi:NAD(P) transhydrogenase